MHAGSSLIQLKDFKFEQRTKALSKPILSLSENKKAKDFFDLLVECGEENTMLKKSEHDVVFAHSSVKTRSLAGLALDYDVHKGDCKDMALLHCMK